MRLVDAVVNKYNNKSDGSKIDKIIELLKDEGIIEQIRIGTVTDSLTIVYSELYSDFSLSSRELFKLGLRIHGFKFDIFENVTRVFLEKV